MGNEVYTSSEVVITLLSPIDGSTLATSAFTREVSISERPTYARRTIHQSAAASAPLIRSAGAVTLKKDAESLALVNEIKRWEDGALSYPLADLKGKRYRHPHLRMTLTNASGTIETITAYDVKLSERSLSRPDGTLSDTITLDALGGIDTPNNDHGEPFKAITAFRTGTASYLSTAGTLSTAGDGVARIGLPYVARRNLWVGSSLPSTQLSTSASVKLSKNQILAPDGSISAYMLSVVDTSGALAYKTLNDIIPGQQYTFSFYAQRGTRTVADYRVYDLTNNADIIPSTSYYSQINSSSMTRVSVTFTAPAGCVRAVFYHLGGSGGSSGTIYCCWPQVEFGSTATPYQATNATGVDLSNPINGAGLVLEGAGTNKLYYNEDLSNVAWVADGVTKKSVTVTDPTGASRTGTIAIYETSATSEHRLYQSLTGWADGRNSLSCVVKPIGALRYFALANGQVATGAMFDLVNGTITDTQTGTTAIISALADGWFYVSASHTDGGSGQAYMMPQLSNTPTLAGSISYTGDVTKGVYLLRGQAELSPFSTSYMGPTLGGSVTRSPDLCALTVPHNLLTYSQDFSQSVWVKGGTSANQPTSAGVWTIANTDNTLYQAVTPTQPAPASLPWTFTAGLQSGTLSGSVQIQLEDQSGSLIGSAVTIPSSSLSSSTTHWGVTATPGTSVTGLRAKIKANSGTGTVTIVDSRLEQASMPGAYVPTTSQALAKPSSATEWPSWLTQNGSLECDIVPPPISTGKTYSLIGQTVNPITANTLALWRHTTTAASAYLLNFDLKHNSSSGSWGMANSGQLQSSGVNLWDGGKHRVKLVWQNYILSSVRCMPMQLWIDANDGNGLVLRASADVAALYGATAWVAPERLWLSDGNTYSTISNLVVSTPSLPTGAIPSS